MVLQRIYNGEQFVFGREGVEIRRMSYFGGEELEVGKTERITGSSDIVSFELRRKSNPERKDGRVGDNYCILPDLDVYAVADGVSNSFSDSRSAVGISKYLEKLWQKNLDKSGKEISDLSLQKMHNLMLKVVSDLQEIFLRHNKKNPEMFLATTFSMVKIYEKYCLVVSVGDSPVFLQKKEGIEQITIAQDTIRQGTKDNDGNYLPTSIDELDSAELNFDKRNLQTRQKNPGIIRNNPTSLLGREEGFSIDFYMRKLKDGNKILLATDGAVKANDILSLDSGNTLSQVADTLTDNFDGSDDATILILE